MNRDKLNYAMYEGWCKMAFYFLTFFYYLYSMIYVLITYWKTIHTHMWINFEKPLKKIRNEKCLNFVLHSPKTFCHLLFISLQKLTVCHPQTQTLHSNSLSQIKINQNVSWKKKIFKQNSNMFISPCFTCHLHLYSLLFSPEFSVFVARSNLRIPFCPCNRNEIKVSQSVKFRRLLIF